MRERPLPNQSMIVVSSVRPTQFRPGPLPYLVHQSGAQSARPRRRTRTRVVQDPANGLSPGTTMTPLLLANTPDAEQAAADRTPLGRAGQPADMANAAVFLASPAARLHHRRKPGRRWRRIADLTPGLLRHRIHDENCLTKRSRCVYPREIGGAHSGDRLTAKLRGGHRMSIDQTPHRRRRLRSSAIWDRSRRRPGSVCSSSTCMQQRWCRLSTPSSTASIPTRLSSPMSICMRFTKIRATCRSCMPTPRMTV